MDSGIYTLNTSEYDMINLHALYSVSTQTKLIVNMKQNNNLQQIFTELIKLICQSLYVNSENHTIQQ